MTPITCPSCETVAEWSTFDCAGLDGEDVQCPCGAIFNPWETVDEAKGLKRDKRKAVGGA